MTKLYRPNGNHGVRMLMTTSALEAHRLKMAYFDEHGTYGGLDFSTQMQLGFGTFTFTTAAGWLLAGAADRHYGTHDMFDHLTTLFEVERVSEHEGVYVPFSNGREGFDDDFANGYGAAKRNLFQWLVMVGQEDAGLSKLAASLRA